VSTPQSWISSTPANLATAAPIKARACDALQAVLKNKQSEPRQRHPRARIMAPGAERC
jgi:hypothetical protein